MQARFMPCIEHSGNQGFHSTNRTELDVSEHGAIHARCLQLWRRQRIHRYPLYLCPQLMDLIDHGSTCTGIHASPWCCHS